MIPSSAHAVTECTDAGRPGGVSSPRDRRNSEARGQRGWSNPWPWTATDVPSADEEDGVGPDYAGILTGRPCESSEAEVSGERPRPDEPRRASAVRIVGNGGSGQSRRRRRPPGPARRQGGQPLLPVRRARSPRSRRLYGSRSKTPAPPPPPAQNASVHGRTAQRDGPIRRTTGRLRRPGISVNDRANVDQLRDIPRHGVNEASTAGSSIDRGTVAPGNVLGAIRATASGTGRAPNPMSVSVGWAMTCRPQKPRRPLSRLPSSEVLAWLRVGPPLEQPGV